MNGFKKYAEKYDCSLVDAFLDRDFPMTATKIAESWKEATGRDITKEELAACKPDSQDQVNKERLFYED